MTSRVALLVAVAIGAAFGELPAVAQPARRPASTIAEASGPVAHLLTARSDVVAGRLARAADALGRAEARLLNDAAATPGAVPPFLHTAVDDVVAARAGAARRQRQPTIRAINAALLALEVRPIPQSFIAAEAASAPATVPPISLLPAPPSLSAVSAPVPPPPSNSSTVLYRALPGHWTLRGADSVWVEAEPVPQPVSVQAVVPPRQVWNGDRWILVPEHFSGTEVAR